MSSPDNSSSRIPASIDRLAGLNAAKDLPPALADFERLGSGRDYAKSIGGVINKIRFFEDLSDDDADIICSQMQCFAAKRGQKILCENDTNDFMVIILTGEVSVVKAEPDDTLKVLAVVNHGTSLGEMSLIDGTPRFASCVANVPTDFAVLTRDGLFNLIVNHPPLGNKILLILLQIVSQRLRETSERLMPHIIGV